MLSSDSPVAANLGDTSYAKTTKELIQFVSTLRALGAQVLLDLPRIVVIGNQSAGKSSLVEAISGIAVPRDAGTCTRCPMECRLSHWADSWSCQIYIRWEFDDAGLRVDEVSEVPFGACLTDRAEVEPMLRRAQAAILNPSIPLSHFLDADIDSVKAGVVKVIGGPKSLSFSKNVICVDLAGPELIDLSFVDLPGIVQNAEPEIVQLVEDLVTSYVGGNCLILVTLPMSDDIENQKAARIAKHADPQGLRTIGVLTKPDTLPAGATKSREMWLDVLEGRRHVLQHGYFCTRQPDDDRRLSGIAPADARNEEVEFFRTTTPWSTSTAQGRFGTTNLVRNISELLTQIISDSLPKLLGEVATQLEACKKQLRALPPRVTTEPAAFVFSLVVAFCAEVLLHIEGSPSHTDLVQTNRSTFAAFKSSVLSTAPSFVPYEANKITKDSTSRYTKFDDEGGDVQRVKKNTSPREIYLGDVRDRIAACLTRELPNNVPYSAKRSFIRDFQQSWSQHAMLCFERVNDTFKDTLTQLIKRDFDRFSNLKAVIVPIVVEQLQIRAHQTTAHLKMILKLESAPPFTQNTHYLSEKRDTQLSHYRRARSGRSRSSSTSPSSSGPYGKNLSSDPLDDALAALAQAGYPGIKKEDLAKLTPPDEFEDELQVMADVRAYFQVAYKRVIDYIPLSIDQHLLYAFAEGLHPVLFEKLGLGTSNADARCASYIAEEPGVVTLRSELLSKQKKLTDVQKALFKFGL